MANRAHVEAVRKGAGAIAAWREANKPPVVLFGVGTPPTLDLTQADFGGANLSGLDLDHADFRGANLTDADLRSAILTNAKLGSMGVRESSDSPWLANVHLI